MKICILQNILSRMLGAWTRIHWPPCLQRIVLTCYIHHYAIDVTEANKSLALFHSLDDFFCRSLKAACRPIDRAAEVIVAPVDGTLQACGELKAGTLIQCKGIDYRLADLIPSSMHQVFQNGKYLTIYLSPADCHRVFSPVDGHIIGACHVPGYLFPVRQPYVSQIDGLFIRNERLITYIRSANGLVAVVKVGALGVGNIGVEYDPTIRTNQFRQRIVETVYSSQPAIDRGELLGMFHLGSTVILLFPDDKVELIEARINSSIKYGMRIARWRTPVATKAGKSGYAD